MFEMCAFTESLLLMSVFPSVAFRVDGVLLYPSTYPVDELILQNIQPLDTRRIVMMTVYQYLAVSVSAKSITMTVRGCSGV